MLRWSNFNSYSSFCFGVKLVAEVISDVNVFFRWKKTVFFPEKTTKIKKNFFFLFLVFTFCHIFIVYFLSFKVYPHFTKGFCPPHVYSPIANLLLTLFPYYK